MKKHIVQVMMAISLVVLPLWLVGLLVYSSPGVPSAGTSDPPIVTVQTPTSS